MAKNHTAKGRNVPNIEQTSMLVGLKGLIKWDCAVFSAADREQLYHQTRSSLQ